MRTFNRATIIGRVGNEVVLRTTRTGKTVVNLNVATNERRRDGVEVTTWHRTVLWDQLADYAGRFLSKGDPVYVEGRLGSADWTDKDGGHHQRTEITASELIGLGGRGGTAESGERGGSVEYGERGGSAEYSERGEHGERAPRMEGSVAAERTQGAAQSYAARGRVAPPAGQRADGEELDELTEDIPF